MSDAPKRTTPPATTASINPDIAVQGGRIGNGAGYSGEEYDSHDHLTDKALKASGEGTKPPAETATGAIPADNGKRAFFDEKTGAVHGSGAGAGGGNAGEDFDSDPATGDGILPTGSGRGDKPMK